MGFVPEGRPKRPRASTACNKDIGHVDMSISMIHIRSSIVYFRINLNAQIFYQTFSGRVGGTQRNRFCVGNISYHSFHLKTKIENLKAFA